MKLHTLTYAGHSSVFLKSDEYCIGIDPWLEPNPLCPDSLKNPDRLDLIVLTHGHPDHAGDALRLGDKFESTLIATYELASALIADGYPESKVIPMNKGGTITHDNFRISLTHALHSNSYEGKKGTVYAGEACGTIIADSSQAIYHAGDTLLFSDMSYIKELYNPKVALFPVGDHFTMGPKEASIAASLVGASINIPIHHSTFPLLHGTAEHFSDACNKRDIHCQLLEPGEDLSL